MKKNSWILTLLVFAVFAVCILMILLGGAQVVKRVTARDDASFQRRTAAQYLTTRIRQAEEVLVRDGMLVLSEEIDGETYETRVYCHDGYLRELFAAEGFTAAPEYGEKLLPMEELYAQADAEQICLTLVFDEGDRQELILARRKGETNAE